MVAPACRLLLVASLATAELRGFTPSTELATPIASLHHRIRRKAIALFGIYDDGFNNDWQGNSGGGSDDDFGQWGQSNDDNGDGDDFFTKQRKKEHKTRSKVRDCVFTIFIMTLLAYYTVKFRLLPARGDARYGSPGNDWTDGWYRLNNADCNLLFMGICCWPIRWAETFSMLRIGMPFWTGYMIVALLYFVGSLPGDLPQLLGTSLTALFMAFHRQKIRYAFGFRETGGDALARDALLYCCCTPCAVIQDAKLVESAFAHGHEATHLPPGRRQEVMVDGYLLA